MACHQTVPSALQQRAQLHHKMQSVRGPGPSTPRPPPRLAAPAAGPGHGPPARGRVHRPRHNATPRCPSHQARSATHDHGSADPRRPQGSMSPQSHTQTAGAHTPPPPPTPAFPGTAASVPLPTDPERCPVPSAPPRTTAVHSQAEESPTPLWNPHGAPAPSPEATSLPQQLTPRPASLWRVTCTQAQVLSGQGRLGDQQSRGDW